MEVKVSAGDAGAVICEMAHQPGAQLLVMGSHGYMDFFFCFDCFQVSIRAYHLSAFQGSSRGSVSDHRARNAKCPVPPVKRPAN